MDILGNVFVVAVLVVIVGFFGYKIYVKKFKK